MRINLLVFVAISIIACNNKTDKKTGENKGPSMILDSSMVIGEALAYADKINSTTSSLKRDSVDLEGLSTEGGEMIYYTAADSSVVFLAAKNYGETGQNEEHIWLKNKQPVLQYLKDIDYDKPMYEPGSTISKTTVTYIVLYNGAPFVLLDSARQRVYADSATFAENAERFKAVLPDYLLQVSGKQ
jgi:hypothetical protein